MGDLVWCRRLLPLVYCTRGGFAFFLLGRPKSNYCQRNLMYLRMPLETLISSPVMVQTIDRGRDIFNCIYKARSLGFG